LKRYDAFAADHWGDPAIEWEETEQGDWVKYEDLGPLWDAIRAFDAVLAEMIDHARYRDQGFYDSKVWKAAGKYMDDDGPLDRLRPPGGWRTE